MIGQLPNSQTEKKRLGDTLLDLIVLSHENQSLSSEEFTPPTAKCKAFLLRGLYRNNFFNPVRIWRYAPATLDFGGRSS
jgi:hypothetical protein